MPDVINPHSCCLSPVVVALDFDNADAAFALADQLEPTQCRLKVGKTLFVKEGPALVKALQDRGFDIFLDLKFYDIPNQVAGAVKAAADLGVWMLTLHASGGRAMLEAAATAAANYAGAAPHLVAVTLLTSFSNEDIQQIGYRWADTSAGVLDLAKLTQQSGVDGVVCSAQEAQSLRQLFGKDFLLVTPGIRPADAHAHDQKRIMTPNAALEMGSNYLVIGRPITESALPLDALKKINVDINA